jgi:HEAT repeat protein
VVAGCRFRFSSWLLLSRSSFLRSKGADEVDDPEAFVERRLAALIADLQSTDEEIRWDAASDLREMGTAAAAAVPSLVKVLLDLRDSEINPYCRGMACDALGAIGLQARDAVPALVECTADETELVEESRWLRLRAAAAIFRITGDGEITRRVAGQLADDPEEWLREKAKESLEMLRLKMD